MKEERAIDVLALGELLIDFTGSGTSKQGNPLYEANPGGAPCNVLAMLQKLSRTTAFVGKVGNDTFGRQLARAVAECGIDDRCLRFSDTAPTTLAFVHTFENGDRDFSFYRRNGADTQLTAAELDEQVFADSRIFHFGSLSLTQEPARSATYRAEQLAGRYGLLRSFDPNLRLPLWPDGDKAHEQIAWGLAHCDILKISDNEIIWFTGISDYDQAVKQLRTDYPGIQLLTLSLGAAGSRAYYKEYAAQVPAFLRSDTIETTGAGDTFCACVLDHVLQNDLYFSGPQELRDMLRFANAAASLITTRKGALRVMPEKEEVEAFLASQPVK